MIRLVRAAVKDAEHIWKMQVESFSALLEKYRDYETSPASEPVGKIIARLEQPFTYYYLILQDDQTVGAIRVVDRIDGTGKRRSPTFVLPEFRNRGIAQRAILEAECLHGAENWSLDTILQETGLCRFYEKLGYKDTGKREPINDKLTLIFYEK